MTDFASKIDKKWFPIAHVLLDCLSRGNLKGKYFEKKYGETLKSPDLILAEYFFNKPIEEWDAEHRVLFLNYNNSTVSDHPYYPASLKTLGMWLQKVSDIATDNDREKVVRNLSLATFAHFNKTIAEYALETLA